MRLVLWLAVWLLLGCVPEAVPATALVVSVQTDLVPGSELRQLSYRVFASDADPDFDPPISEYTVPVETLAHPFVVLREHADELLLSVEGFAQQGDEAVVIARVRAHFVNEASLALPVFLARACWQAFCEADGLTCYGERWGEVAAGQCAAISERAPLDPIVRPGDEADWQPMGTALWTPRTSRTAGSTTASGDEPATSERESSTGDLEVNAAAFRYVQIPAWRPPVSFPTSTRRT